MAPCYITLHIMNNIPLKNTLIKPANNYSHWTLCRNSAASTHSQPSLIMQTIQIIFLFSKGTSRWVIKPHQYISKWINYLLVAVSSLPSLIANICSLHMWPTHITHKDLWHAIYLERTESMLTLYPSLKQIVVQGTHYSTINVLLWEDGKRPLPAESCRYPVPRN